MRRYIGLYLGILTGILMFIIFVSLAFSGAGIEGEGAEVLFTGIIIILLLALILTVMIYIIDILKKELRDIRLLVHSIKKDTKKANQGA
ncbi:hypothetical protein A8F94_15780 [Bacillus sp. FJAT-27225]|uniref:hypothetical protein n=1 Tax=Bacillus sp. FJAT-27225 TaxID=1743144 RepID=UPI00080C2940|nr:hypothetical protein [Bacillus sp. FJAT-27225]OCA84179.1 hypothetical protein A8F94_15780 [Bacillus sp. FJAT-27225]